ncbi:hypothetical protein SBADM41S_01783 [Streptomyces badius]
MSAQVPRSSSRSARSGSRAAAVAVVGPAQPRMVAGLGERMQGEAQLGQGRGRENDAVGGESAMSMCTLTPP